MKDRYPSFFLYDSIPLSKEDECSADFNQRVGAIWKFLVKKIMQFQGTMVPRERAAFDPEDTLQTLYLELRDRDAKWDPERGRYITFASEVIAHEFTRIREHSRTVKAPRNAYARLSEYEISSANGTLSARSAIVAGKVRSVVSAQESWTESDASNLTTEESEEESSKSERRALARAAVLQSMGVLTALESVILGHRYGLWGKAERTDRQIASATGNTVADIRAAARSAEGKLKERLSSIASVFEES